MTATNHAVAGAIIAVYIHEPVLALPLALASHFVLDSLPHIGIKGYNRLFTKVLFTDILVCSIFLIAIILIKPAHWQLLISCALLAMSPDLMWLPRYIRHLRHKSQKPMNRIMNFHKNIQRHEIVWGYFVEIPWFIISLLFLIVSIHEHIGS